jgi:hypothetical protein
MCLGTVLALNRIKVTSLRNSYKLASSRVKRMTRDVAAAVACGRKKLVKKK